MTDADSIPAPVRRVVRDVWRVDGRPAAATDGCRAVPAEIPVAFDYDGVTYAVMMATPADLEDFARGFSLTEGLVATVGEIEEMAVVPVPGGAVLRLGLTTSRRDRLWERRRHLAGPSGCGLCGIESLAEALRSVPSVTSELSVPAGAILAAMARLVPQQVLNRSTRAVHAAAFWQPSSGTMLVREDVGRHNALDKLVGAMAQAGLAGSSGVLLLTSRLSVELVQKAAMTGVPIVVAVSAPTALALDVAQRSGITLAGIAREDGFELFTHPERITRETLDHVA